MTDSTTKAEYIVAREVEKEIVWIHKFIQGLGVVHSIKSPISICCDNTGAAANAIEPRSHKRTKHIERRFHLICEIIKRDDVAIAKISLVENDMDPFTEPLSQKVL